MSEVHGMNAERRERAGKGAARATRRAGRVPGVIYGGKQPPIMISLEPRELQRELQKAGFFATLFDLQLDGQRHRVLARDLQLDPVTDVPIHIDFLRVAADTKITVDVPVTFTNEELAPGLKRGGMLNIVRHEVELVCAPDDIPTAITVDLQGLDIGDSVHISMVTLPAGVTPSITDRDFTIATIAAPTVTPTETEAPEGEADAEAGAAPVAEKKA